MLKKFVFAACVAATGALAACSGDDAYEAAPAPAASAKVNGPLNTIQHTLSNEALAPLADATSGTPLAGVVVCTDALVSQDTLDIGDSIAIALLGIAVTQSPDPLIHAAGNIQRTTYQMVQDLEGLLGALAGSGGCGVAGPAPGSSDPLAGTPLAPLADALTPVLAQIEQATGGAGAPPLPLSELAALFAQLDAAYQDGLSQVPAEARAAPIVGGALSTIGTALSDLATLLTVASGNNSAATELQLQRLFEHTLVNLLTQVVPVTSIEAQAGQPGVVSGPVRTQAAALAQTLADGIGTVTQPVLEQQLGDGYAKAWDPTRDPVMPLVLEIIRRAIAGETIIVIGPTGTPLDGILIQIGKELEDVLGGQASACLLAGTPLAVLCL